MLKLQGAVRECEAATTLKQLEEHLLPNFGITRVANITGLDNIGIPVYVAIRPNGKCLSVAQGKGITSALAKTSAVMESIETWYAENIPDSEITTVAKAIDLSKQNTIFPVQAYAEELADIELAWVQGEALISTKKVLIPKAKLSLDTTKLQVHDHLLCPGSNGLASGNSKDEAICHSLCELIERDAVEKWLNLSDEKQNQSLFELSSINYSLIQSLLETVNKAGLNLYLWDITSAINVPSFYCAVTDSSGLPYTLFSGHGTHFSEEVAMSRAITEACQARLTYISGSRDDIFPSFYDEYDPSSLVREFLTLKPERQHAPKMTPEFVDFEQAKLYLLDELYRNQIDAIYCYQHKTLETISVVHCLAPQLQGNG